MSLTDARMSSLEDKIVAQAEAAKKESRKEKIKKIDKDVEEIKEKPKKK